MYRYIIGMVKEQEANYIILECNNIGYLIYVANPYLYEINKVILKKFKIKGGWLKRLELFICLK